MRRGTATSQYAFPKFHSQQQQYSHHELHRQCFSGTLIFTLFSIIFTNFFSLSFVRSSFEINVILKRIISQGNDSGDGDIASCRGESRRTERGLGRRGFILAVIPPGFSLYLC